jgi:voltage-gated potassium channel
MDNKPDGFRKSLIAWVRRREDGFNTLLAMLSITAVALVVSGEMMNLNWVIPVVDIPWIHAQKVARTIIWLAFVSNFAVYCVLSRKPLSYIRHHLLEAIICACWVPHYTDGSLHVFTQIFVLSRFVPLDMLMLFGTLAHAWKVLKFTEMRFRSHPVFITGAAAILVVCSAAALLQHVEPQTFHTFWDAAWFALTTVTTIGFGDLVPKTPEGRIITSVLIVTGISLAGIFLGLVSEIVRNKLFAGTPLEKPSIDLMRDDVAETKKLVQDLQRQQAETADLVRQLLAEKKKPDDTGSSPKTQ